MKLSRETLTILKNFSTINAGIYIRSGTKLSTIAPSKTVLAQAELRDEFPVNFGIYDLHNFLSVMTLEKELPTLEFDSAHVIIKSLQGRSKLKYRFTDKSMIVIPPDKSIPLSEPDYEFDISDTDYAWIIKISNVLQSPHIAFEADGTTLNIKSFDATNDSAHSNSTDVGAIDLKFRFVFKTENLKMIPGSYHISLHGKGIGHFMNEKDKVQYWIAMEK